MTIAAGFFMQEDGLLLCADSQYTGGSKINQQKLFGYEFGEFGSPGRMAFTFALAGHEINGKTAIEECVYALSSYSAKKLTHMAAWRLLRAAIHSVHSTYVDSRSDPAEKENARFDLIIGCYLPHKRGLRLYKTSGPGVTFGDDYYCTGIGAYLGDYMMRTIFAREMSLRECVLLAIQAVAAVTSYDANCGGETQMRLLLPGGGIGDLVEYADIPLVERYIAEFERSSRKLLFELANPTIQQQYTRAKPDERFNKELDSFVADIKKMRLTWIDENFESLVRLLKKKAEGLRRVNSTRDLKSPLPSPE
jgi:hypothetical protein